MTFFKTYRHITPFSCIFFASLLGVSHAAIRSGSEMDVQFDSQKDIKTLVDVRYSNPDSEMLHSAFAAQKGTRQSGAVTVVNVGPNNRKNDVSVIYAPGGIFKSGEGKIILNSNETLSLSLNFRVKDPHSAATPRLGLISRKDALQLTHQGENLNIPKGNDMVAGKLVSGLGVCIASEGDKLLNIVHSVPPEKIFSTDKRGPYPLIRHGWYQMQLKIFKSPTEGEFDVSVGLHKLFVNGTHDQAIAHHSATIIDLDLYKEVGRGAFAGFNFVHDKDQNTCSEMYDNLHIKVESGNSVGKVLVEHVEFIPVRVQKPAGNASISKSSVLIGVGGISIVIPKG